MNAHQFLLTMALEGFFNGPEGEERYRDAIRIFRADLYATEEAEIDDARRTPNKDWRTHNRAWRARNRKEIAKLRKKGT